MNSYLQHFIHWFFPARCLSCDGDLSFSERPPLCRRCLAEIYFGVETKAGAPAAMDELFIGGLFQGPLRELIHAYKYGGKDYLAPFLAEFCTQKWPIEREQVDMIIPVPLSLWKKWKRGYNQSELLARQLGKMWGKPVCTRVIKRHLSSVSQTKLNREHRHINAEKSYVLGDGSSLVHKKSVLLVDDVATTGFTLAACARLLKKAGARAVLGATIAYETQTHQPAPKGSLTNPDDKARIPTSY